jgi:hypothetical protein
MKVDCEKGCHFWQVCHLKQIDARHFLKAILVWNYFHVAHQQNPFPPHNATTIQLSWVNCHHTMTKVTSLLVVAMMMMVRPYHNYESTHAYLHHRTTYHSPNRHDPNESVVHLHNSTITTSPIALQAWLVVGHFQWPWNLRRCHE